MNVTTTDLKCAVWLLLELVATPIPASQLPHLQGSEILLFLPFMGLEPGSCKSLGSTNELALEKIHLILPLPDVL